jgi:hypothetical protein
MKVRGRQVGDEARTKSSVHDGIDIDSRVNRMEATDFDCDRVRAASATSLDRQDRFHVAG